MFVIRGEGIFEGDNNIANGMALENRLKSMGFMTVQKNCGINILNNPTKTRRWQFEFGARKAD